MDSSVIEVIIQGGAVGLALATLGVVWYALKLIGNHLTDVSIQLGRSAETQRQNSEAQRETVEALQELTLMIEGLRSNWSD